VHSASNGWGRSKKLQFINDEVPCPRQSGVDIGFDEGEINFSEKGGIGTACLIFSEQLADIAGDITGNHFSIRRM
jgi:hypothetical protein